MIVAVAHDLCTGCKACGDICPTEAITFADDSCGFWHPVIHKDKCTQCGACDTACPVLNRVFKSHYTEPDVYSGWNKDPAVREYSTSGGVYNALASYFLDDGGVVLACVYSDDCYSAHHAVVLNNDDIYKSMQSKYVQSDCAGIYKEALRFLKEGRRVLFCGGPCQSAAVQNMAKGFEEQLFTMDYICLGNTSPLVFRKNLEYLENQYNSKIIKVHAKNKDRGWQKLGTKISFQNGQVHFEDVTNSNMTKGYIQYKLFIRMSCHNCLYRTFPRISDFTVGDFWGIKNATKEDLFKGISVILANSDRAKKMFSKLSLHSERKGLHSAVIGNPCFVASPIPSEHRSVFFSLLETMSPSEAVTKIEQEFYSHEIAK